MNDDLNQQVDTFINILLQRFGISESELQRWVRVIPQLIDHHEKSIRYGEFLAKTFMGAIAIGLVGLVFSGIGWAVMHFLRSLNG